MTKAELIARIEDLAAQYLGSRMGIAGLTSHRKADLAAIVARFERMVALHQQAEELRSHYTAEQRLVYELSGAQPADLQEAGRLNRAAQDIWLHPLAANLQEA